MPGGIANSLMREFFASRLRAQCHIGAYLAAVLYRIGERRADARIDFGMQNSHLRIGARFRSAAPIRSRKAKLQSIGELGIESDAVEVRDAGEHLAADAARAEETKRGIAFRSSVRDTKRSERTRSA